MVIKKTKLEIIKEFQKYLDENKIINKILLKHEIDDPREKIIPHENFLL